jgi:acetoin:2,6-dichlorophenolindophenol oxidoreductase subunit beta
VAESDLIDGSPLRLRRLGYAPVTCPTTSSLESLFYPNAVTVAETVHRMCRPDAPAWHPDPRRADFAHHQKFRGPF